MMQLVDFYAQIIQKMPVHIYWKDTNFIYLGCNLLQAKNLGFNNEDDLIGKTDFELLDIVSANAIRANDMLVFKSQRPHVFEEAFFVEHKKKIFLTQKIPLFDEENQICGIAGISFDISERKAIEKNIIEEKAQLELALSGIIDNLPGHIYWKSKDGIYKGCNLAQAISAGFTSQREIIGKTDYDLLNHREADVVRKSDSIVMRKKKTSTYEEVSTLPNSNEVSTFLSKKSPLFNQLGDVVGLVGISLDITDRKKIEEALQSAKEEAEAANYLMTEFISNMGHDLATPISDVGSVAEALKCYADEYTELQSLIEILVERSAACEAVRKRIINATAISNLEVQNEVFSTLDELLVLEKERLYLYLDYSG